MSEWFSMGGYAVYVWPSIGLTVAVLIWNWIAPMRARRQLLAELARRQRRAERRQ
ncbi:MAG: heme exporter protein CcmD [Chromatiales bacterium]|nr:heme exporter protein CcmD [Chromatiales bacterium]